MFPKKSTHLHNFTAIKYPYSYGEEMGGNPVPIQSGALGSNLLILVAKLFFSWRMISLNISGQSLLKPFNNKKTRLNFF